MISASYILMWMILGHMPWDFAWEPEEILDMKRHFFVGTLVPRQFAMLYEYCIRLEFLERPNYGYMQALLGDCNDELISFVGSWCCYRGAFLGEVCTAWIRGQQRPILLWRECGCRSTID